MFVISPSPEFSDSEVIAEINKGKQELLVAKTLAREIKSKEVFNEEDNLKHVEGRVIIKVEMQSKNSHTFEDGTKIYRGREFNNFNLREVNPVNAIVISGENLKHGMEVVVDYACVQETYQIQSYKEKSIDVKYYSVPESLCYLYKDSNNGWQAVYPYETALRVFEPYNGTIEGILPKKVKDVLYCTSGEFKGLVLKTLLACDYEVIFQDANGREGNIIRFLPNGDDRAKKEPEAISIMNEMTDMVNVGKLYVGLSEKDCKPLNIK